MAVDAIQFFKVTALPGTPVADAIYFVQTGADAIGYATDQSGVAHELFNTARVTTIANTAAAAATAGQSAVEVYADIAARDADQANLGANAVVLVKDASADTSVTAGAALYIYEDTPDTFSKIAEFESLDIVVNWADIVGAPTSTPSAIDAAVANSHTHANKTQLDLLGQDGDGLLTYNGSRVDTSGEWTGNDW